MVRLLHLSDLHLGYRVASHLPGSAAINPRDLLLDHIAAKLSATYSDARYRSWEGQRLDLVLISGDLFDTHRPSDGLVRRVIAAIKRIQNLGAMVITVPGNHDELTYPDSVYRVFERDWPGLLVTANRPDNPIPLMLRGQRIYLISMAYDGNDPDSSGVRKSFPGRVGEALHICLVHGLMTDDNGDMAGERCFKLDSHTLLQSGYDYIALGHSHSPYLIPMPSGNGLIACPGMLYPRDYLDPAEGKLLFVELERGSEPQVEWVALDLADSGSAAASFDKENSLPKMFSMQELHALASQETLVGELARLCMRDLFITRDPDVERQVHLALRQALQML